MAAQAILSSELPAGSPALLDRDLSILAFNERVLDWARRKDVPLLERLRYLCIVSSNLDEFFEVRVAPHVEAALAAGPGTHLTGQLTRIVDRARQMVDEQYRLYNQVLLPAFKKEGIRLLSHGERSPAQRSWVQAYFNREVKPLLVPVGIDPAHPLPQVANKSLNFIIHLRGKDAFGRHNEIAILKVPRVLPRVIELPERLGGGGKAFVLLSSVIRAHLSELFPGREVDQFSQFRVTRHSDLSVDEDDVVNLRMALRQGLQNRNYGQAVRLEVSSGCAEQLSDFLLQQLQLPKEALLRVNGPVNLVRLTQFIDLAARPNLLFAPCKAGMPLELQGVSSILAHLRKQDVLIHQPFESFDGVLAFLREAVRDPDVLAIKQTIYRTGSDPAMLDLLREAVRRGKEVTAVVELKARFDEEANINWAEQLEAIGVQVVYGVVGLKTHAKMLLVTRREGKRLRRYGHLSTGNYNPRTARLYTDISFLTADARITADMDELFMHLASQNPLRRMQKLLVAPFHLHARMCRWIEQTAEAARNGQDARIILKMNALTDQVLIEALMEAGQAGVQIDLIVRGACLLPAGVPGQTETIRVRSVIGRFLEHSRVFYFRANGQEALYLSSADWMNRNMMRRVEVAWPVDNPVLRQRLMDECLTAYLLDQRDAWCMNADGRYEPVVRRNRKPGAQQALTQRYMNRGD